ncbi:class E sortase [Corynebacterium sp. 21KM1197]|uniref:class E sortase n=1 Tax=Corynebacterium sp. 21KM1197 TaxID=2989734 RepID=UPI0029CAA9F8|nr:class E sortase [Corynebacterium sp. 21KM1197]WPF69179.1 class E sortase [Corynebacterium sp. 21KM1197]
MMHKKALHYFSGILLDLAVTTCVLITMLTIHLFLITPHTGARHESNTVATLNKQWKKPDPLTPPDPIPTPEYGDTFATASIPRLGDDWEYSIKATTSLENLRTGIAWYSLTALPGETGNFSLAAHRDGSTAPFANIDTLQTCDDITINTQGGTYTYTVLPLTTDPSEIDAFTHCAPKAAEHHPEIIDGTIPGQRIVEPTTVQVVNPTPGEAADVPATAAWLTLTSCHPHFSNAQRIIVHAILTQAHGRN